MGKEILCNIQLIMKFHSWIFISFRFLKRLDWKWQARLNCGFVSQEKLFLNSVRSVKRRAYYILLACKSTFPIDNEYQLDVLT